ncbi:MAG: cytochrome c maturation protein CcmE [Acidimicrobiales bacterium]
MTRTAPEQTRDLPRPRRTRPRARLLIVTAVLIGALVYLLAEGLGSSLDYFDTVSQALSHRASLGTSTFRLEGLVVPGSVRRTVAGADFNVSEGSEAIAVVNTGAPPALFQADLPVVVVGHFASGAATLFMSNQVMVKHSANYIAAHPGRVRAPNGTSR